MNMDALELCSSWPSYAEGHRVAASDVGFRIRAAAATPRAPFCYAANYGDTHRHVGKHEDPAECYRRRRCEENDLHRSFPTAEADHETLGICNWQHRMRFF
jgi:hypothetical protein